MYAVSLSGVSKKYNIYDRPSDRLKELIWRNRRCYHREFWALRPMDLKVETGTNIGLIGPNGSGKSTLLQIIAGVVQPTTGTVEVQGRITAILELGAGFQPDYTGRENVILNGLILGIPEEELIARLPEIAEYAEIGDFFDQPVRTYSSGMVVRLAFAAAVSVDPQILLVDEALAVGDERFQMKCFKTINKKFCRPGKTIIFVSHDMTAVQKLCNHVVLLNGGKIVDQGEPERIIPQYEELMSETGVVAPKVFTQPATIG